MGQLPSGRGVQLPTTMPPSCQIALPAPLQLTQFRLLRGLAALQLDSCCCHSGTCTPRTLGAAAASTASAQQLRRCQTTPSRLHRFLGQLVATWAEGLPM